MTERAAGIPKVLDLIPGRCWSRAAAWLWISQQAGGDGRVEISSRVLSARFGWPRTTTRRFLEDLERCGLIQREKRRRGPFQAVATICIVKDFSGVEEISGPSQDDLTAPARAIRAPTAPDKRLAFFAKMITGPDEVPPGVVSPIMARALISSGAVTPEAMRRKGVAT